MAKLKLGCAAEMRGCKAKKVAAGDWLTVTRKLIDEFADATHDQQWLDVDPELAGRDLPLMRIAFVRNG